MSTRACLLALLTLSAAPASAQRGVAPVTPLTHGALSQALHQQRAAVSRCASAEDSGAYLVELRASVRPGPRPSSMFNARIAVQVRSRPRDGGFEACVRRGVQNALQDQPYAVERSVSGQVTFRLDERPDRYRPRPPAPEYSEAEASQALRRRDPRFAQCIDLAGVPERITMRVAVEADGRLTLLRADVPPGSSTRALECLRRTVEGLRVRGAPARRRELTHTVAVRG